MQHDASTVNPDIRLSTARKSLLVLMPLGSEVRQFGHSGLLTLLIDEGWRVVVAAKTIDSDLGAQFDPRVEIVQLPAVARPFTLEQTDAVLDQAHALRQRRAGKPTWEYKRRAAKTWKEAGLFAAQDTMAQVVSRSEALCRLGRRVERYWQGRNVDPEWLALMRSVRPSVVLVNIPKMNRLAPALACAAACGRPTVVVYHTWKDVSAAGRLSHAFSAIGVWNESMKAELLRQNPEVDPATVEILGCAHFDCVGRNDWLIPEQEFRARIGARPGSRLLFFAASAPWVVPQEERYLAQVWADLCRGAFGGDVELLVRLNPMDQSDGLLEAVNRISPDILVSRPDWRWDSKANWCFQRTPDLLLYNSLLTYASVCFGAPSTVTVECAVAGLPVVNLGFEVPGPAPLGGSLISFWNADFYREVRECGAAMLADSPEALRALLLRGLGNRQCISRGQGALLKRQLGVAPGAATPSTAALLRALAAQDKACT